MNHSDRLRAAWSDPDKRRRFLQGSRSKVLRQLGVKPQGLSREEREYWRGQRYKHV